jgi:hypothetical protein
MTSSASSTTPLVFWNNVTSTLDFGGLNDKCVWRDFVSHQHSSLISHASQFNTTADALAKAACEIARRGERIVAQTGYAYVEPMEECERLHLALLLAHDDIFRTEHRSGSYPEASFAINIIHIIRTAILCDSTGLVSFSSHSLIVSKRFEFLFVKSGFFSQFVQSRKQNSPVQQAPLCYVPVILIPNACTISKHTTKSNCPTRSINAECIGSAYISGSRFLDQRKLVRALARMSDVDTFWKREVVEYFNTRDRKWGL